MQIENEQAPQGLNILFVMLHPGYIRNYESAICALAERGHRIHIEINQPKKQTEDQQGEDLVAKYPGKVSLSKEIFPKRALFWCYLAKAIYGGLDYLRYLHPIYADAPKLRERLASRVEFMFGPLVVGLLHFFARVFGVRVLQRFLGLMARALPPDRRITEHIRRKAPDIVLVTPLVNIASHQADVIKSAKALGIPCGLGVASWDNLTNKGLIRIQPDLVIVWNEHQKKEAVELHGVDPARVAVTGAQCYDKWFDRKPSLDREAFLERVGLPAGRPYLLYLCSSPFIAPEEVGFVEEWARAIRNSGDPALQEMSLLVRPHPQNAGQWRDVDFSHLQAVSIYPRLGANPVSEASRNDFFDSICHASAVVGVNTSTMIESGIAGKPVFSIRDERFRDTQDGTLHFHYLVKGGLLHLAESFDQHLHQIKEVLRDGGATTERVLQFIKAFVRPAGLDVPSTPIIVDAIERFGSRPAPSRERTLWSHYPVRLLLYPLAVILNMLMWLKKAGKKKPLRQLVPEKKVASKKQAIPEKGELPPLLRIARPALLPVANFVIGRPLMKHHVIPWLVKKHIGTATHAADICEIEDEIKRVLKGDKPILVGPWISEVGFELLYWIPFLRWVMNQYNIPSERIVVVSRGGAQPWYEGICGRYIDVFDFYDPEQYKVMNEKRIAGAKTQKHNRIDDFDHAILEKVKQYTEIEKWSWLHPSYMYRLFQFYWKERCPISLVGAHTKHQKLAAEEPSKEILERLPEAFVAVKFYFSACFPETPENKQFIVRLLRALSQESDVVLLSTGLDLDDHTDFDGVISERIHKIEDLIEPRNNLAVQTAIIGRASAFYGTYGGFSYLAPIYGVPSVAFYSHEDKFLPSHLDVAYRASRVMKFGYFNKVKTPHGEKDSGNGNTPHEFIALNVESLALLDRIAAFSHSGVRPVNLAEEEYVEQSKSFKLNIVEKVLNRGAGEIL